MTNPSSATTSSGGTRAATTHSTAQEAAGERSGSSRTLTLVHADPRPGLLGAGVDLVCVDRFGLALDRCGDRLVQRLFCERERAEVAATPDRAARELTTRFSVKESVVKFLGGLRPGWRYADIAVGSEEPASVRRIRLQGALAGWDDAHGVDLVAGSDSIREDLVLSWVVGVSAATAGARVAWELDQ